MIDLDHIDTTWTAAAYARTRNALRMVLVACCLGVLAPTPASAHQGWFNLDGSPDPAQPYRLPSRLDISQVVFGELEAPNRVDYYAFTAPPGFALTIGLIVPDVPSCAEFRPALILSGPGLGVPDSERGDDISTPVTFPAPAAGEGSVLAYGDDWDTYDEMYTATTYRVGPSIDLTLRGGDYLLAVFDSRATIGTYGVSLAGAEIAGGDPVFDELYSTWRQCEIRSPLAE